MADDSASAPLPLPIEAGWYPDVDAPGRQRFWSGNDWTDMSRPAEPDTPRSKVQPQHAAPKPDDNRRLMIGLIIGFMLPIGGVAMGIYMRAKKDPKWRTVVIWSIVSWIAWTAALVATGSFS